MSDSTLSRIFVEHQGYISDKWEHYLPIYESAFNRFVAQGKPVRLLEIGVQNGGSLQIWSKYLPPGSVVVGVDIDPACAELSLAPNIVVLIGDASDPASLERVLGGARFDIIIDDGSHRSEHVIATFGACFVRLNPGGVYVIEDLHASYFASHGGGLRIPGTSMEWLKGLLDALNVDYFEDNMTGGVGPEELQLHRDLGRQIGCISFFDSMAVIEKMPEEKRTPFRRTITGRSAVVADVAEVISALPNGQLRSLLLPPATLAAFTPAALGAVADARERVGELQTLLSGAEAQARTWKDRARKNEEAQERAAELQTQLASADARASALARRAEESELARERILLRMKAARRDLYGANFRREEAEASAQEATAKWTQAEAVAAAAGMQASKARAELDALLSSTSWKVTSVIRVLGSWTPSGIRRVLRGGLKLSWWTLTFKLRRKLRERREAAALQVHPEAQGSAVSVLSSTQPAVGNDAYAVPTLAVQQPEASAASTTPLAQIDIRGCRYRVDKHTALCEDDDVLVYVAYCADGLLTELQVRSIETYHTLGYRVVVVVNSGMYDRAMSPGTTPAAIEIVRENIGFDFGAWSHVSHLIGGLDTVRSVTFANDSVIGPLPGGTGPGLRDRIRNVDADAVFLTKCLEIREHMQSYFFTLKAGALTKGGLEVIRNARSEADKQQTIQNEELFLSSRLEQLGVTIGLAFPCPDADLRSQNPTIHHWRTLLDAGYPFVKGSLVSAGILSIDDPALIDALGTDVLGLFRSHLARRGFTVATRPTDPNVPAQPALAVKGRFGPIMELQAYNPAPGQVVPIALPLDELVEDKSDGDDLRSIAILAMVHCFYVDEAESVLRELATLSVTLRVVLTTDTEPKATKLRVILRQFRLSGDVVVCPNRGRDVAPLVIEGRRQLRDETIILHLHTKKSPHSPIYGQWASDVRCNLVGSTDVVRSILHLLSNDNIGVVYSDHFEEVANLRNWGYDFGHAYHLMRRLGVTLSADALLEFPTGTMFWARADAVRPLFDLGLSYEDFEPEAGQVDGTLAHAIERCLLLIAEREGFTHVKVRARVSAPAVAAITASCRDIPYLFRRGAPQLLGSAGVWPRFYSEVGEIYPVNVARSRRPGRRLNLLVPTAKPDKIYGGVTSAFRCAKALRARMGEEWELRVIITSDEVDAGSMQEIAKRLCIRPVLVEPNDDTDGTVVVDMLSRKYLPLMLRAGDVFFATAWWTADLAFRLRKRQQEMFGGCSKLVYLIQDYEPGFYPWSDKYSAAEATYLRGDEIIALMNTEELANFMTGRYRFSSAFYTPYELEQELAANLRPTRKQKQILVYGRPSTPRNLFGTIVEGIRVWQGRMPSQNCAYEIIFAGEAIDVSSVDELENARVLGKLSLSDYAQQLNDAAIGVSIMISPHPSYPPLEMAAAGCVTITNQYEQKDLSRRADNIISLAAVTPQAIADGLDIAVQEIELAAATQPVRIRSIPTDVAPADYHALARAL